MQAEIYSWQLVIKPGIPPEDPQEDTSAITDYLFPTHQTSGSVASLNTFRSRPGLHDWLCGTARSPQSQVRRRRRCRFWPSPVLPVAQIGSTPAPETVAAAAECILQGECNMSSVGRQWKWEPFKSWPRSEPRRRRRSWRLCAKQPSLSSKINKVQP